MKSSSLNCTLQAGEGLPLFLEQSSPLGAAARRAPLCQAPLAPVHTEQQHLIRGSLLSAEPLAAAPWGQKEKSVLTSFFRVESHFFVLTELNQLFLAQHTSKSGTSQLLSETINANHLWFVRIRVPSPSCTAGSTDAFKTITIVIYI